MTRLHVPIPLRWGDLDAFNHVNNATLLKLLEEARVRVFWKPTVPGEEAPPTAVIEARLDADTLTLVAHQEIEYLAPIPYQRDPLDVELWMGKIGGASMQVSYEVYSPLGATPQVLYAKASTTVVLVDSRTMAPRRIGDIERAAWEPYLEEPVQFSRR
ncbi:acyl-CoA thioesterase [Plantibacter sp. Mn2098]|uniref:acyl-CoA thioesterase n=1 Tax=Plantibacter sp. Mn2098 TaxID=3395266 RepID=UPI003BBA800F